MVLLGVQQAARALEIPLHPTEARIVEQIIAVEGHSVEAAEVPGWAKGGVITRLKGLGIETGNLKSWGVQGTENKGLFLSCIYDSTGRVLALLGSAEMGKVSQAAMASIAKITTITSAEIVKRHSYVAVRIASTASGPAADELKKAIAEFEANKKSTK